MKHKDYPRKVDAKIVTQLTVKIMDAFLECDTINDFNRDLLVILKEFLRELGIEENIQ